MKPRALDLFCGAGGATKGLQMAGFHVTGIDIKPQPRYCGDLFIQGDALRPPVRLGDFDLIWASPPCQAYSWGAKRWPVPRANLIPQTREMLSGHPLSVIENVVGAPVRQDVRLDGPMFGLGVLRRRHFETSFYCLVPQGRRLGTVKAGAYVTVAGHGGNNAKGRGSRAAKQEAMGIYWMSDVELNEAIPPVYAEHIGRYAMMALGLDPEEMKRDSALLGKGEGWAN